MQDEQRGVIRNRGFACQIKDFSGLRFGTITPTDIDGMIEYQNRAYVYIELKHQRAELPPGQKLAFQRQCDDMQKVKPTLFIIASHDTDGDIDVANTEVVEYRYHKRWKTPDKTTTTRQIIEHFLYNVIDKGLP